MKHRFLAFILLLSSGCTEAAAPAQTTTDAGAPTDGPSQGRALPEARLEAILEELRASSSAPGAILGVSLGGKHWSRASGIDDVRARTPMRADLPFRIASVTKIFTGIVAAQLEEEGVLAGSDVLARWLPDFPQASATTLDMLLSHTGGVTGTWFEDPQFLADVTRDLSRVFTPTEVIARVALLPPAGAPGSAMVYSNAGFVLTGEVAKRATGSDLPTLVQSRVVARAGLTGTRYAIDPPPGLANAYFSYQGLDLDTAAVDQQAIVSTAGAAGAMVSTVDDLTHLADELFRTEHLVRASTRAHMMAEVKPGAGYGRALMLFCPCTGEASARTYAGFGHGGYLPGVWSLVVYYPSKDLSVAMMINRDNIGGAPVGRDPLDRAAQAIFEAIP